jgi:hypothetical protein
VVSCDFKARFMPKLVKPSAISVFNVSPAARKRARLWLESPEYETSIRLRILSGSLPPGVEMMLWHYAYGKPAEQVEVDVTINESKRAELASATDEALQKRVQAAVAALSEARKREAEESARDEAEFEKRVTEAARLAQEIAAKGTTSFIPDAALVAEGEHRRAAGVKF